MPGEIQRQLQITSAMKNLQQVREFISQAITDSALSESEKNRITLAVDESVANVVKHGYGEDSEGIIEIEVLANDEKFQTAIMDTSQGFDLGHIQAPDMEEHVRKGRNSGLGIFIIRQIMDEIIYKSGPKNQLIMIKYI